MHAHPGSRLTHASLVPNSELLRRWTLDLVVRMHDQNGDGCGANDPLGHASEHAPSAASSAVASDDHQVGGEIRDRVEDGLERGSAAQLGSKLHASILPRQDARFERRSILLVRLLRGHVEDGDVGAELRSDVDRPVERELGSIAEIEGNEDVADGPHPLRMVPIFGGSIPPLVALVPEWRARPPLSERSRAKDRLKIHSARTPMSRSSSSLSKCAMSACLAMMAGCASYSARPIRMLPANWYAAHTQVNDLLAGAEALDTPEKSSTSLGVDITAAYSPVQFVLDNKSTDKWMVDRAEAKLKCGRRTLDAVASQSIFVEYKNDLGTSYVVAGWIGISAASDANDAMKADWAEKEFPAQFILGPNQRKGGVLFFRGSCRSRHKTVVLAAENMTIGDDVSLELDLGANPEQGSEESSRADTPR